MSYRVISPRTRALLSAASAKGLETRWGKTREVRAARKRQIIEHFQQTGSKSETARALGLHVSWVRAVVNGTGRAAFPVDAPEVSQ